ncbi:MAG TPA: FKBP-type peptidyl-prolyl cis-trans isomerase [Candidatus Paceibacterota bacterium]|nr:FKBP-type peptidyl-prolyl cis-trans isomerase [Candidatus Paceibacterota bacterium]
MNTKSVLGIIIVIIIIALLVVWLRKTPPAPTVSTDQPAQPVATQTSSVVTSNPSASSGPTAQTPEASAPKTTTTIDGMKIEVTKEGSGEAIKSGQTAVMLYTGKLADGSVFDSTAKHGNQPFSFTLGAGQVIKGWDEGIVGMKVGEQRTLVIPAALGYGANGYPPVIPANATLTFDVTLVAIK